MVTVATLLILGFVLLFAEVLLPGMIAGIIGFGCLAFAVILGFTEFGFGVGINILVCVIVTLVIGTIVWFKYFPDSRIGRLFVSEGTIGDLGAERRELLGQKGEAISDLRPSGFARIDGQRIDVVTRGEHLVWGTAVEVIEVEGMRVVVRVADDEVEQHDAPSGEGKSA